MWSKISFKEQRNLLAFLFFFILGLLMLGLVKFPQHVTGGCIIILLFLCHYPGLFIGVLELCSKDKNTQIACGTRLADWLEKLSVAGLIGCTLGYLSSSEEKQKYLFIIFGVMITATCLYASFRFTIYINEYKTAINNGMEYLVDIEDNDDDKII